MELNRNFTDWIKFFSCIMVAVHHYSQYVLSNDISHNLFYQAFSTQGGYLGVAVFFFLSGYGLMKSDMVKHLSFGSFVLKRFMKIYLPVLLVTATWLPIYYALKGNDGLSITDVLYDLLWNWRDGVLWFIKCLLKLYIVFALYSILRLYFKSSFVRILSLCILATLMFALQYFTVSDFSSISVPLFFCGIGVAEFKEIKVYLTNKWISVGAIILMIVLAWMLGHTHKSLFVHAWFNYFFILLWMILAARKTIEFKAIPKWMATMSFDVYLVHMKCLSVLLFFLPVVPLYYFVGCTVIVATVFGRLRAVFRV